jgi:bifunctional non-homologous end joining protein LigD
VRSAATFAPLPEPMLSRPGPLPTGRGWRFEVKWDGFRAVVSTEDGLRVRSRRGWNMTSVLPELRGLPKGLVLDGELVAFRRGEPYFPDICRRVLNGDRSVVLTYVLFDLLRLDGEDMTARPYRERRSLLEALDVNGAWWTTPDTFSEGESLYAAVCERGLEGVVAKLNTSTYRPGDRGWVKVKNRDYWRWDMEHEGMRKRFEPRTVFRVAERDKLAAATERRRSCLIRK